MNTRNIDNIFKSRISKDTNLYKNINNIYTDNKIYNIYEEFELNNDSLIYNKKPLITYVNKLKNKNDIYNYIKKLI